MLIELNSECIQQFICCSLDWISKFPDECEVLIARSLTRSESSSNSGQLSVIHNADDLQIVQMAPNKTLQFDDATMEGWHSIFCLILIHEDKLKCVQGLGLDAKEKKIFTNNINEVYRVPQFIQVLKKMTIFMSKNKNGNDEKDAKDDYILTRNDFEKMLQVDILKQLLFKIDAALYYDEVMELQHFPFVQGGWMHKKLAKFFLSLSIKCSNQ